MSDAPHIFPPSQAAFLRGYGEGCRSGAVLSRRLPRSVSLVDRMPPVYQQALRGTCVANAVTALLEYFGDCRTRLSVQYLFAATKEVEREGLERNLAALREGRPVDANFESVCHAGLMQLRMLADANGGFDAPAVKPFLARFEEGCRARFAERTGSLLMSCFRALETRGICRHALWPYAAAAATPVFGAVARAAAFPPGTDEDAAKRRMLTGLYLLPAPNNVDEIRGLLAGANGRRPMPVAVTVDFFEGCDGETYAFPRTAEDAEGRLVSESPWNGRHGLLIVGYEDDASAPGGGFFAIRNSLGEDWGRKGYGRLPYAYLECFAVEAGTILQDLVDYEGDGYDGIHRRAEPRKRRPIWLRLLVNLLLGLLIATLTIAVGVCFDDPLHLRRPPTVRKPAPLAVASQPLAPLAIPPDTGERRDCQVVARGRLRGSLQELLATLLPDVGRTREADAWGERYSFRISVRRMRLLALALQAFLKADVYQQDHGASLEILGEGAPAEVVVATDCADAVKRVLALPEQVGNVKLLSESGCEMVMLVLDREALLRDLGAVFTVNREEDDFWTVRKLRKDTRISNEN